MANQSPSRPRTKTSDFTEFFRGAGHSNQLRHPQIQKDSASMNLEVPTSGDESCASISRKKITRIPLFGRSRKKSNQSTASSPFATSGARHSVESGEPSSRAPSTSDRRPSEPTPPPPLPVPSKAPSKASTSLTSKFAAHFSHSRSTKVLGTPQAEPPLPPQPVPSSSSSGLAPPDDRSSSLESSSSRGTRNRSTTPRPARPTITVSLSADTNNDEFKDLFTRPTDVSKRTSKAVERAKQQSTPTSSPAIPSPEAPMVYKRGQTPASAIAAAVRHQQNSSIGSDRPPSTSSKQSNSRKNSDSDKSVEKHDGTSTPRPSDSPRESPRLEKGLPPSLSRRTSAIPGSIVQSSDTAIFSTRSRMKPPSTHSRSRPPSIPLPLLPPSSPPPSTPLPSSPADLALPGTSNALPAPQPIRTESGTSQKIHVRPRAHTISSSVSVSVPASVPVIQSVTITTPTLTTDSSTPVTQSFDLETLDIDTAPIELLRQALKARNKQYADVTALVLKMTEEHLSEISTLEKKISVMEREARKRDTQIKGFTWLFNDRESSQTQPKALPSAVLNQSRFAPSSSLAVASDSEYDGSTHKTPYGGASRRLAYQSDSGAESHATSGAESLRASGSESVSSGFRNTKIRISRTATMRSSKIPPAVNGDKFVSDIPYSKRSSMSSVSASPSSSTSSLLPPSPSITMSSLSAIPEGSNSPETLRLPRYESFSELSEERRAARASQRVSISSLASSSTAASSSYSVGIKRSRPPSISIAQVLEKSPEMQDTLENLRRFS